MPTYHFDLDQVSCIAQGVPISEYAQGDAIVIEFKDDDFVTVLGHHGSVIRAKKPNTVGDAKLQLSPGSPVHDILNAKIALDVRTGTAPGLFMVKDLNGTTMAMAPISYCTKRAGVKAATEPGSVEYPFTLTDLEMYPGSNRFLVPV